MEPRDFVEFLKVKDHMLAVQFSIDPKKFDSFRKPFVTNKYLSVIQWEEIMHTLNRALCKQLKLSEEEQMNTNGEFKIDDSLLVTYSAKPKDECCIDFSKLSFAYDLSWMLLVTISKPEKKPVRAPVTPKKVTLTQATSSEVTTASEISTLTAPIPELEYEPSPQMKELMSRYTPGKSEGPNRRVLGSPEYCPQSSEKASASTYTASRIERKDSETGKSAKISKIQQELFGSSEEEVPKTTVNRKNLKRQQRLSEEEDSTINLLSQEEPAEEVVVRPKKRGLLNILAEEPKTKMRTHKKVTVDGWLKKSSDSPTPSKKSKAKSNRNNEAGVSKRQRTTKENEDPIDFMDDARMRQIYEILEKEKILQEQREERKQELKDIEIKDCTDLTNDEIKRSIRDFAPTMLEIFKSKSMNDKRFNSVLLTTSNILTESQVTFVLREIESHRPRSEQGFKEDILTEYVLPELIMYLFCNKFKLSIQEALKVLNVQEEYQLLNLGNQSL